VVGRAHPPPSPLRRCDARSQLCSGTPPCCPGDGGCEGSAPVGAPSGQHSCAGGGVAAAAASQGSAKQVAETLTNTLGDYLRTNSDGVRTLLLDVTRPTASAWWSISLLVAGLGLQTLANVIQVMRSAVGS
jgi:hypothetical protein